MITFKDFRNKTNIILLSIYEESAFYIYRTDTNAVLDRGINGFEAANARANQIRKIQNLKWDQVKFKSERGLQGAGSGSSGTSGSKSQFDVSSGGRSLRTPMARNILLIIRGTTIHRRVDTFVVIQIHRETITISTDMTLEHEQLGSATLICDHQRPRIRASGAPAGHPPDPSDAGACL